MTVKIRAHFGPWHPCSKDYARPIVEDRLRRSTHRGDNVDMRIAEIECNHLRGASVTELLGNHIIDEVREHARKPVITRRNI